MIGISEAEENLENLVELTRQLMLMRTTEFEPAERRRCIDFIRSHIDSLPGIEIREFERNHSVSLLANPIGHNTPDILMCGHIDVVAHPEGTAYRGRVVDGQIVGPGAGDMKGAVAIILEVFRNTLRKNPLASVGIAITSDEEIGGADGVGYLFGEAGVRCGLALVPDGGSLNRITIQEKGILHLSLNCAGRTGHAARPWLADSATEHLIGRLQALREHFDGQFPRSPDDWHPTCAITTLSTPNRTINRVAGHAHANLDVRFPPPHTSREILESIRRVLGPRVEIETVIDADPADFAPDPLFQKITERVTGTPVELERSHGGSDARFIAAKNIPAIISCPLVGNLHSIDEWIDIESMGSFYKIYEQYINESCPTNATS